MDGNKRIGRRPSASHDAGPFPAIGKTPLDRICQALELGRRGRLIQKWGRSVREADRARTR